MKTKLYSLLLFLILGATANSAELTDSETAVIDEQHKLSFSTDEIKFALTTLPENIKTQALKDDQTLMNVVGQLVETKNLSQAFDKILPDVDSTSFWKHQYSIRGLKSRLYMDFYKSTLDVPDMSALAREDYKVNAGDSKLTGTRETRQSSHILVQCEKNRCNDEEKRKQTEDILAKLNSGESFVALAEQYSEDPASAKNKGLLSDWYEHGHARVDRDYTEALFKLKAVGDISGLVRSKYGYHIIRLDGIRGRTVKPYDEVKDAIIERLENKYRELAFLNRLSELQMSEDIAFSLPDLREMIKETDKQEDTKSQ